MDLSPAINEPLAKRISFHNDFGRNVKLTYGALAQLGTPVKNTSQGLVVLPKGGEPRGRSMAWRDLGEAYREAAVVIAEMGIATPALPWSGKPS
jgi:hypothetical protein